MDHIINKVTICLLVQAKVQSRPIWEYAGKYDQLPTGKTMPTFVLVTKS